MRHVCGCAAAVMLVVAIGASSAKAGGFYVREQSTAAMGSAYAGASAYGHDASYMFYNPAVIADLTGTVVTVDGRMFFPDVSIQAEKATSPSGKNLMPLGNSGSMADDAIAPAIYAARQVNDRTTIGIGFSAPFAVKIESRPHWAGEYQLLKTSMVSWNLTPTIARRIGDHFAVAFGLNVQGLDIDNQRMEVTPFGDARGYLRGSDVGAGWTAGLTWDPLPGTRVGLGYRSPITHSVRGTAGIVKSSLAIPVSYDYKTPTVISAGFEQDLTERLTLLGEVEWNDWSVFDGFHVRFDVLYPDVVRALTWQDTWFFSLGGRYQATDRTSFTAGFGWENAVADGAPNTISPDGDRTILGIGLTHRFPGGMSLSASYAHIWFTDATIDVSDAQGTLKATMTNDLDVAGISLTKRW
ncbi:MAG: outer membrane protein transport protein [Bauldia sp.]|uniref:OmpP1/FadL family transporter n=1 Tax=Bauldia sp. TaxID=2575872 RepID=UPI001DCC0F13|nr:outer membrane protein transport protein [Bauldia sp.]MCB1494489.1 outer membrane protein transport protein [Bauldia sp.]